MHIRADGTLTIHALGIERTCKSWEPDPDGEPHASWLRPRTPLTVHRIESPFDVV
jgi:hypothetical protein